MVSLSIRATFFTSSALAALLATSAHAQETATSSTRPVTKQADLQDIVVTARREAESLIKVPVAVTALSSDTLVRNNVTDLQSAAQLVPFVQMTKFSAGNGALLSIRGIGSTPSDAGVEQSVLVNIDNVLIGRGRAVQEGLYDLSQIEVLKGPQALFYGKNSPAGVVSVTTADPGNTPEGYVRAGYEFKARERYVEGAYGGPVTDTLKVRLAGRYAAMRGWIHNIAPARPYPANPAFAPWVAAGATLPAPANRWGPHTRDIGARLTAIWEPTDALSLKLKYSYGYGKNAGDDELYVPWCGRGRANLSAYGSTDPTGDCRFDNVISVNDFPAVLTKGMVKANNGTPYGKLKTHMASLSADYQINDNLSLTGITGFYDLNSVSTVTATPPFAGIFTSLEEHTWSISQELRLSSDYDGPVNFVLGAYIDRIHQFTDNHAVIAPLPADPATGAFYSYDRFADFIATSQSVFGQIRWDILENLELAGGVRYTNNKRDSLDGISWVNPALAASLRDAGDYFDRVFTGSNYSPEATLTWHPEPNQTLYVAYKTGYKSGGFSYPSVLRRSFDEQNTVFKPETVKGFEVGYKARLLNGKAQLELTAYETKYKNQQLSSFDASILSYIVNNVGRSRLRGVELQGALIPTAGLNLHGAFGYNQAKYLSYVGAPCIGGSAAGCSTDFSGRTLPRAPKWSGNFGANLEQELSSALKLSVTGDAFYTSSYLAFDNLDPESRQESYWKLNASVSVASIDDRWKLSLIGRNLTNEKAILFGSDLARGAPGDYIGVPVRSREIALEISSRF